MAGYTNSSIETAIADNDIAALREAIGSICYTDRTFANGEFINAINYVVHEKKINIYENYNQKRLISKSKSTFSSEDFGDAIFDLKENFCEERVKDVMDIGKALYKTSRVTSNEVKKEQSSNRTIVQNQGKDPNARSHQTNMIPIVVVVLVAVAIIAVYLIKK